MVAQTTQPMNFQIFPTPFDLGKAAGLVPAEVGAADPAAAERPVGAQGVVEIGRASCRERVSIDV